VLLCRPSGLLEGPVVGVVLMNKFFLMIVLLLVPALAAAQEEESRIAAVVNDSIVTDGDLAARLKIVETSANLPDTPENRKRLEPQVLRSLIDEKLQMQEAKRLGISVSKEDIADGIADIERRNHMPKGALDQYLAQRGISRSSLIDQITASIAFSKIVQNRVSQDVQVSDDEVNETMKQIESDIGRPQSRVAEIFLAVDNPSQEDEVRRLADRILQQIQGGANFSAMALQFSQSPSAAVGGDIGWVTPGQLSPILEEAVDKMAPGQMSYPIRTPAGFYLLYVLDRRTLGALDPAKIVLSLNEVVFAVPATASADDRQKAVVEAQQVAAQAKSCGEMAKIGAARASQLSRQIPQVKASDLPADIRDKILALKIAEASQPLPLEGGVGIVMVCRRQDPPGLPSRDEVEDSIGRQRLDTLARRYMSDLRRDAFVDIRE
jgi:peptidyl-prolyl cis-trans isomerase SurA